MKKITILGSTGFIGKHVEEQLAPSYHLTCPKRSELDILDANAVWNFLKDACCDVIINAATPTGHNPLDKEREIFERSLRVFASLTHCNDLFGKMIYIGSGAEYGKHREIRQVTENKFGAELPRDAYGLSRYIMSELAEKAGNIYNLRIFGCYGIGDPPFKLIPHIVNCIKRNKPIELNQNTLFDFLYVRDIASVMEYFIENKPNHKAYNLCSGNPILIGGIAEEVRRQMNSDLPIVFKKDGYGPEYTGNNKRLRSEISSWQPSSIDAGIKEIIEYENRKI